MRWRRASGRKGRNKAKAKTRLQVIKPVNVLKEIGIKFSISFHTKNIRSRRICVESEHVIVGMVSGFLKCCSNKTINYYDTLRIKHIKPSNILLTQSSYKYIQINEKKKIENGSE